MTKLTVDGRRCEIESRYGHGVSIEGRGALPDPLFLGWCLDWPDRTTDYCATFEECKLALRVLIQASR